MLLQVEILDIKNLQDSTWFVCKGNLMEYLQRLKPTFYEYIIQRKIVKNKYLNSLVNTILIGEPVPIITLTTHKQIKNIVKGNQADIEMNDIEILDGLQRTFRLWAYYKIITEYKTLNDLSPLDFSKRIKEKHPEFFDSGIITLTKIKDYYKEGTFDKIELAFKNFEIYFFVWSGLSGNKAIHKMLVLNAGQRPVSLSHQYELLFLYVWEEVKATSGITLYRDRDPSANKIKLGERKAGEYMFSSVIAGLRSFLENKPKRISIDDLDIEDLQGGENNSDLNEQIFTKPYITTFLTNLKKTDEAVIQKEKTDGQKWFVRDTTISGFLAGLGKYIMVKETMPIDEIEALTNKAFAELLNKINTTGFRLNDFQEEYYKLQSRTVNVGTYVRTIIMEYTIGLLTNTNPSWKELFSKSNSKTSS